MGLTELLEHSLTFEVTGGGGGGGGGGVPKDIIVIKFVILM